MGGKLAILVGGGPAPGINSVIAAATIRGALQGLEVLGIRNGFEHVMKGDVGHAVPLTIDAVSRIHFRGGSHLGTSRANPTKEPGHLDSTVRSFARLGVGYLATIGGDDTLFSAMKVAEKAGDRIKVVHVPKTIDNDLDLPAPIDTFGFQTARHLGVALVQNIIEDARTTSRWYFIVSMGRKAGHLALGIGKAAGATLTLIPEEFPAPVRLKTVVDTLAGAVLKRMGDGKRHGVAVIAEGLVPALEPKDLAVLETVERDPHGNIRIAEVDIGQVLKKAVQDRLKDLGVKIGIVAKTIGYELRCADPIPYDMEYTRDLGYCAAKYLLEGGSGMMITMQGGKFVPIPFTDLMDPSTGRSRVRMVDVHSPGYAIARRYMIRLRRDDFTGAGAAELAKISAATGVAADRLRAEFGYLAAFEPSPLTLRSAG